MGCINYNCGDFPEQILNACGDGLLGGIDQVVLLDCDTQLTDPSNGTQVQDEITAGRAVLYKNIKVGFEAPSPVEVDSSVAGQRPKAIANDYSATWEDANVNTSSSAAYNSLDASSGIAIGGLICHLVDEDEVIYIAPPKGIYMKGGLMTPNDNNAEVKYMFTLDWRQQGSPSLYSEPSGIFD